MVVVACGGKADEENTRRAMADDGVEPSDASDREPNSDRVDGSASVTDDAPADSGASAAAESSDTVSSSADAGQDLESTPGDGSVSASPPADDAGGVPDETAPNDSAPDDSGTPSDTAEALQARVIVFDWDSQLLATLNASADVQQDFWPVVANEMEAEFSVSWDTLTYHADGTTGSPRLMNNYGGLEVAVPAGLLVVGLRDADGGMDVQLHALDGSGSSSLHFEEQWQSHSLSPQQEYLLLHREVEDAPFNREGLLIRLSDGAELWRGQYEGAVFAPDDRHLVVHPTQEAPVGYVDLETGVVTEATNPDFYDYPSGYVLSPEGISPLGCVLRTYGGVTYGQPLWHLDWLGNLSPLDSALPLFASERLVDFQDGGRTLRWYRSSTGPVEGYEPIDEALLGYFEYDVASGSSQAIPQPGECDVAGVQSTFEFSGSALAVCSCRTKVCSEHQLSTDETGGWSPGVTLSPRGRYALVSHFWSLGSLPSSYPASVLFDTVQETAIELPYGRGEFSKDETLLLLTDSESQFQLGVVELESGGGAWRALPRRSGIVYE